jgi:hypothetical protein
MTAPSLLDELASEAKWLRKAAEEIAKEGHAGWGNTCTQAAECIERHHATIAGMAKRLEAAERDARATKRSAETLCRIYFEIAAEAVGEDKVRAERDRRIHATQEGEG